MALFSCYSGLARQDLLFHQVDCLRTSRKKGSGNYCKTLNAIERWDQKLWPISAVIPVWRHKTSSSCSRDSTCSTRKRASGNYCKYLSTIQQADQKLWPFSAVILVWRHKTSSSTSRDSIGSPRKRASGNYCKYFNAINGRIKSYGAFQLLLRSGATRPLQLVGIP